MSKPNGPRPSAPPAAQTTNPGLPLPATPAENEQEECQEVLELGLHRIPCAQPVKQPAHGDYHQGGGFAWK